MTRQAIVRAPSGHTPATGKRLTFRNFRFGSIEIDGTVYTYDVVIEGRHVRKRKKKLSRAFRESFGHTPLSVKEPIPWRCRTLVIGTGAQGALPVMDEVRAEAEKRGIELIAVPTGEAIARLEKREKDTNAILHLTC